jgi:hypothetical protein
MEQEEQKWKHILKHDTIKFLKYLNCTPHKKELGILPDSLIVAMASPILIYML